MEGEEEGLYLAEYVLLFVALTTAGLVAGPMSIVNQIRVAADSELSKAASTAGS